ncbi:blue light receptor [Allomyces javanicus]|nr:blue light receptor [Allomyces javanicus]
MSTSPPQSDAGSSQSQSASARSATGSAPGFTSASASGSGSNGSRSDGSAPRVPGNQLLAPPNDARHALPPQQLHDCDELTTNDYAALRSMFANAAVVANGAPHLHAGPSQAHNFAFAMPVPAAAPAAAAEAAAAAVGSQMAPPLPAPPVTAASGRLHLTRPSAATTATNGALDPSPVPLPPSSAPAVGISGARTGSGARPSAASATGRETPAALLGVKERQWAHSLIDKILDLMLVVAPNGTIVWSSPSAPKVVGFPCTELSSHHLGEFLHPEDMAYLARILTVTVAQDSHFVQTFRFRRKNADYILLEIAGRVLHFHTPASANGDAIVAPASNSNAAAAAAHPLNVPYGPGNVMAAAAAMATAQYSASLSAPLAPRSPLVLLTCREYPQSALTEMLDAVVDLRNENLLLRQRLNGMYERAGKRVPDTSALHDDLAPKRVLHLDAVPEPDAMVVDDPILNVVQSPEPAPAGPADEAAPPKRVRKKRKPPPVARSSDLPERACIDCGTTQSPEWRKGPTGAKTLCNACGLRFAKRKKMEMEPATVPPGSA